MPAVQKLAGLELAAVATNSRATADAAAQAFGAKAAYGDATSLFRDREIDLVAVCVKVPEHLKLMLGALAAGKHVGVTLVTIQGAHTLDLAIALLGGLADASAMVTTQYPEIQVGDESRRRSTPDHILVQARLANGAALSVEVAGGRPPETPFRLEVIGEKGTLALQGGAARGFQSGRLRLSLNGRPQQVDEGEAAPMPDTAANVAGIYAALRDDIAAGTSIAPPFPHAVQLSRLIDGVMSSARTGTRVKAADWPA